MKDDENILYTIECFFGNIKFEKTKSNKKTNESSPPILGC